LVSQLHQSVQELKYNKNTRAVIFKSDVDGVSCAGADLKERATMTQIETEQFVDSLRKLFTEIEVEKIVYNC